MRFRVLRPSCALRFLAVFRAISGMSSLRAHTILRCVTPRHRPFDFVLKWGLPLLSLCVCVLWACATMLDGEVVMAMPPPFFCCCIRQRGASLPCRSGNGLTCTVLCGGSLQGDSSNAMTCFVCDGCLPRFLPRSALGRPPPTTYLYASPYSVYFTPLPRLCASDAHRRARVSYTRNRIQRDNSAETEGDEKRERKRATAVSRHVGCHCDDRRTSIRLQVLFCGAMLLSVGDFVFPLFSTTAAELP